MGEHTLKRSAICTYCGQSTNLTADHVPPRSWFPAKVNYQLITVPSCRPCNKDWAEDAEYMRNVVVIDYRTAQSGSSAEVRDKALRSFAHHRGGGPTKSIIETLRKVELRSPAGLVVGNTGAFTPDIDRLERVCGAIVRGLYRHHAGERLPDTHGVGVYITAAFDPKDKEHQNSVRQLIAIGLGGNRRRLGDVFEYDYRLIEPGASAWVMEFYGGFPVVAVTISKLTAPPHKPLV